MSFRRVAGICAAALLLAACAPQAGAPAPAPNGSRLPLYAGHWRGVVKSTLVDFYVDRIGPSAVAIHVNGGLISTTAKDSPEHPVAFVDHPTTCARRPDGYSFDCARYKDMHIDNGFLCSVYVLPGEVFRPCFTPIR